MFEKFTDRARRVVVLAQEEARLLNHTAIGTEHLLLGIVHEGQGVAAQTLQALDIRLAAGAQRDRAEVPVAPHRASAPSRSARGPRSRSRTPCGSRSSSVTTTSAPSTCSSG